MEIKLFIDGQQFGDSVEIADEAWHISGFRTYEICYTSGHFTEPDHHGYSYKLFLERPRRLSSK